MIGAAVCELVLGIKAERKSLEDIATPLSADSPEAHSNSS